MIEIAVVGHKLRDGEIGLLHDRHPHIWVKWYDGGNNLPFVHGQMSGDPPQKLIVPLGMDVADILAKVPAGKEVEVVPTANPIYAIGKIAEAISH